MAKIKKAMKGGSKVAGGKKGKKPPESDQVRSRAGPAQEGRLWCRSCRRDRDTFAWHS